MKYAFFGSSQMSVYALDELMKAGFPPSLVVTTPDKPQGRGLKLAPNELKAFALERGLPVVDSLNGIAGEFDAFVVASYGKILPASVVFMPKRGTLNIHPSLLPRYRGASPLQQAILDDAKHTGVTIMRLDEKMDHGPIVAQKEIDIAEWPAYEAFEELMAREGGRMTAALLPDWVAGKIPEREQDHAAATFTRKFRKEDAEIDLAHGDPYENFRKIQAFHAWPQAYFFADRNGQRIRVKVAAASFKRNGKTGMGELSIERVVPEGSREMPYQDFLQGLKKR